MRRPVRIGSVILGLLLGACHLFDGKQSAGEGPKEDEAAQVLKGDKDHAFAGGARPLTEPPPQPLSMEDLKLGTGAVADNGKSITVNYKGYLEDGTLIDSSQKRGKPITFTLGDGTVIEGWDKGLVGMKAGGTRKLVIPAHFAYGKRGISGLIPPEATLVFEVDLLSVE